MIDGLVEVSDTSSFWKLVEEVFKDEQINWGRIIVLFYSVGKLAAKVFIYECCLIFVSISVDCPYYSIYYVYICALDLLSSQ